MRHRSILSLALVFLLVPIAQAGTGLVGLSAGQSHIEVDNSDFDADDTGWKAFGGFNFIRYFGVEGGYTDMGSLQSSAAGVDYSSDISAFGVFARGIVPIGKRVELFGKVGYVLWDAQTEVASPVLTASADDSGNDLGFGAGAEFKVAEKFAIRLEYEKFDIEETANTDFGSVGFAFRF